MPRHVAEELVGDGAHRIEAQELEPRQAQVNARDHVVREPAWAERTAVAHAVPENAQRVAPAAAVLPGDLQHLEVVARLAAHQDPERDEDLKEPPQPAEQVHDGPSLAGGVAGAAVRTGKFAPSFQSCEHRSYD